ncbi:MAG: hypothetical protein ACXWP5_02010, partial [Bdellovibrionota bacterium]
MRTRFKGKSLVLIAFFAAAFLSSSAHAATRTVQFVGNVINHISKIRIDQFPDYYACAITVMNTGNSSQIIANLKFNGFEAGTRILKSGSASSNPPSGTPAMSPTVEAVFLPGNKSGAPTSACPVGGSNCSCTGANPTIAGCGANGSLNPGALYVGIAYIDASAIAGKLVSVCSGNFQVLDQSAALPGSVVAAGSISYVTEMGITGGQFNGAMYMSGAHAKYDNPNVALYDVWTNASLSNNPSGAGAAAFPASSPLSGSWGAYPWNESMQMNLFCAQACQVEMSLTNIPKSIPDENYCNAVCGMETAYSSLPPPLPGDAPATPPAGNNGPPAGKNGAPEAGFGANTSSAVAGLLETAFRNVSGYIEESSPGTPVVGSPAPNPSPIPFHDVTGWNQTAPRDQFRGLVRTANPHFAGGYVMEMIV